MHKRGCTEAQVPVSVEYSSIFLVHYVIEGRGLLGACAESLARLLHEGSTPVSNIMSAKQKKTSHQIHPRAPNRFSSPSSYSSSSLLSSSMVWAPSRPVCGNLSGHSVVCRLHRSEHSSSVVSLRRRPLRRSPYCVRLSVCERDVALSYICLDYAL